MKQQQLLTTNMSTLSATIEKLRIAFAAHGLPEIVVTDNGSNFVSREFEDFLKQNGIRHIRTAPYHPASNGMAERAVQTFKEGMKKMNEGSVETHVSRFLARYRITPQTSTGVSPAELLLGRKPRSRQDLVYPEIRRKVRQSQASQKLAHDWHAKERTLYHAGRRSSLCKQFQKWTKVDAWSFETVELVQLLSRFNWTMDDCLEDTKTTLYRGRASSKSLFLIKRSPHRRQLNSQNYSRKNA